MWKIRILIFLLLPVFSFSGQTTKGRLQELHAAFPYALLTDDFGLLKKEDLRINGCTATPVPFSENSAYSYWQCFEMKTTKMVCEIGKYDPDSQSRMAMLVISRGRNDEIHEYISRRPIEYDTCLAYKREWQRLTKHGDHICISGSMAARKIERGQTTWNWIFGRYKTKEGCDSYFEGECDLNYQLRSKKCGAVTR